MVSVIGKIGQSNACIEEIKARVHGRAVNYSIALEKKYLDYYYFSKVNCNE